MLLTFLAYANADEAFPNHKKSQEYLSVSIGGGFMGPMGLLGLNAEYQHDEFNSVLASLFADFIGGGGGLYYKRYILPLAKTGSIWDKCFLIFECDTTPYATIGGQYGSGGNITISDSNGSRTYSLAQSYLYLAGFGFRERFTNNIVLNLDVTYRGPISGGQNSVVSGTAQGSDQGNLNSWLHSIGVSISVGYIF